MARVDGFAHSELASEDPVVEDGVSIVRLSRRSESVGGVCDSQAVRGGFLLGWLDVAYGSAPSPEDGDEACGPIS